MWNRLDEIYCDVSLNIQCVHSDLKMLRAVPEGDLMGLIKFVDQVELSYSQLGEVAQVNSVTMPMVDELCDLLPVPIRKEWMKIYWAASLEEKVHPFSLFMSYLEDESAISRRLAERQQKKSGKSIRTHGGIAEPSSIHNSNTQVNRCIIHNKPHPTEECKLFLSLNATDRINEVNKSRACYRCFKDHQMKHCRSKSLCTICNQSNHNSLLCSRNST